MLRSLFTGGTGMRAQKFNVDTISNNLANVNTTGFKKERADFESLFYEHKKSPGAPATDATEHPTGVSVGTGVRTAATQTMHQQGSAKKTDNETDLMIQGDGFFQVLQEDGTTAYTRDGSFKLDGEGNLVTSNGRFLQPQIQVPQEATSVTVRSDGTVSAKIPGQADLDQIGQIELAKFVNPSGLQKIGSNLYEETTASGAPQVLQPGQDGAGQVRQGFLETSNVNVTQELTDMISAQRAFEFNQRSIRTSDQMLSTVTDLIR
ncbi:MAG: flagellar basal-body rod protein FlgG [bacterium]